jgi:predicted RNA-binding protein YlxR (DUF448 family)
MRIAVDRTGTLRVGRNVPGRGAWVCSAACGETALQRGSLTRALRRPLTTTDAAALRATLNCENF